MSPNVTGQLLELHRNGKIRILAVNGAERLKAAPDIPTAIEQGVPGMIGLLAIGLFAPAATPQPIVDQIAESNRRAMADPEFQKVFDKAGLDFVADSNTEKTRRFLQEEEKRWGPVVKALNLNK
jgi:tripartite-type tricarboxylate transporter receptor subunit TctC